MLKFADYNLEIQSLNEHVINTSSNDEKEKYKDQVWDILELSYRYIGGIKGSGFESADDMVRKIPYWKLVKKDGKIVAVMLYKDKNGRKMVACGSDGSSIGKAACKKMIIDDIKHARAYGEISDALVKYVKKTLTSAEIDKYFIAADKVGDILNKDVKTTGKYTYIREISGEQHEKMMYGKTGMKFK